MLALGEQDSSAGVGIDDVSFDEAWAVTDFEVDAAAFPIGGQAVVAVEDGIGDGVIGVVDIEPQARAGVVVALVAGDGEVIGLAKFSTASFPGGGKPFQLLPRTMQSWMVLKFPEPLRPQNPL